MYDFNKYEDASIEESTLDIAVDISDKYGVTIEGAYQSIEDAYYAFERARIIKEKRYDQLRVARERYLSAEADYDLAFERLKRYRERSKR